MPGSRKMVYVGLTWTWACVRACRAQSRPPPTRCRRPASCPGHSHCNPSTQKTSVNQSLTLPDALHNRRDGNKNLFIADLCGAQCLFLYKLDLLRTCRSSWGGAGACGRGAAPGHSRSWGWAGRAWEGGCSAAEGAWTRKGPCHRHPGHRGT